MILIVTSNSDVHALCVERKLAEQGYSVAIFDPQELGSGAFLSYSIDSKEPSNLQMSNGDNISSEGISCVWYRRPRSPKLPFYVTNEMDREFAKREWAHAFEGFICSLNAKFVNPISSQASAVKPRQLALAHKNGLTIPRTVITNDPNIALNFINDNVSVIHKAMSAHPRQFLETKKWLPTDFELLNSLPLAPTIFQQQIKGPGDIRATVIGSKIFSAFISTIDGEFDVDSRLDINVPYLEHKLPSKIEEKILGLMRDLDLVFGTVDLKVTEEGDYVFLEINPQGQFLYIEILTGMPLVLEMANYLAAQ